MTAYVLTLEQQKFVNNFGKCIKILFLWLFHMFFNISATTQTNKKSDLIQFDPDREWCVIDTHGCSFYLYAFFPVFCNFS